MADKPLIMSASMVRALLAGRKTMTRRILNPAPRLDHFASEHLEDFELRGFEAVEQPDGRHLVYRSVWHVGDRAWVRESVRADELADGQDGVRYLADEAWLPIKNSREAADRWVNLNYYGSTAGRPCRGRTVPPIHMPRWASRLTLTVTDVRVQRLQDISEEDARAEGATMRPACAGFRQQREGWSMDWSQVGQPSKFARTGVLSEADVSLGSAREAFGALINDLHDPRWNLKGDGIWGENPFVAAISFSVTLANIDTLPESSRA